MVPCFRIWGKFPCFRVLGFGVIFRGSVFQDLGSFSVVPTFRDSAIPAFRVARCDCLQSEATREEECYFQLRRKFRKKEVVWAFERPLFWFEHMVLNHYVNN